MSEQDEEQSWMFGPGAYDPDSGGASKSGGDQGIGDASLAPPSWSTSSGATASDDDMVDPTPASEPSSAVGPPAGSSPAPFGELAYQPRSHRKMIVAGGVAAALVVAICAASFASNDSGTMGSQSYDGVASAPFTDPGSWSTDSTTDPGEDPYNSESSGSENVSTNSPDAADSEDARVQLEQLADEGLAQVSLDGEDVAMIASKWDGITDPLQEAKSGGHVFGYADILAEHERLASEDNLGARVVLLRGSDYGKRRSSPDGQTIYVTFALDSFPDLAAVKNWCSRRFASLSKTERENNCVPMRVTS